MSWSHALLSSALALAACSSASPADAGTGAEDGGEACATVSEADCEAAGCRVRKGQRSLDAGQRAADLPYTFTECQSRAVLCGTALTCARPPDAGAECWLLSDTCLPPGWTRVECQEPLCPRY